MEKAYGKIQEQENSFSCDYSAAMILDLESVWVASMSVPHSWQSGAWQSSWAAPFPGKMYVLSSDRQGSKPSFPWGPNSRNRILLPLSLNICDSGLQRTLGSLLPRSHGPHLNFPFNKQNLTLSKNIVVVLLFIHSIHLSIFFSCIFFLKLQLIGRYLSGWERERLFGE